MRPLEQAISILRDGGLVAFPTETVYGLGADATNPEAIQRIFQAKGRPATNPLIVHVADIMVAQRYATYWPDQAEKLARAFWPGPITLVLPKSPTIVSAVTAGRNTVGLRAPNHPLALELLREFDGALAGPSANRSNHISPTTAQHVREELGDAVDLILDGGPCEVGIESTVIDLTTHPSRILRPGGIWRAQIEAVIGPVEEVFAVANPKESQLSPGQMERHYAPKTPAFRYEPGKKPGVNHGLLEIGGDDPASFARRLYTELRRLDSLGLAAIFVEIPPDTPEWRAVRDRIARATRPM